MSESAGPPEDPARGGERTVRRSHSYLKGVGGVRLFYRSWERPGAEATVVLVHGLGYHSGWWTEVAGELTAAGLSVCAPDLRGHGRSRGRRGHASSFEHLVRDLDRVRRVATADGAGRVVWMGHSLGGLAVLRHLQAFPSPTVLGAVAVAPFLQLRASVPEWKLSLARLADRWLPGLTLDSGMHRDLLLRQKPARERHHRDPLVHRRISARLWGEMQREARRFREDPRTGRPVLLQVAGEDLVVDSEAIRAVRPRMEPEARIAAYPPAYHDLYHDPAAEEALRDLVGWIRSRLLDPG